MMCLLSITVAKSGVIRVDVFALDSTDYPDCMEFHRQIAPEITQLDQAIKEKFGTLLDNTH